MATAKSPVHTLAEKLAHPEWRASLKTSQLPPALAAKRRVVQRQKIEDATVYDPFTPLAGRDLRRTVNTLVDQQTRPQLAALDREGQQATAQGNMISDRAAGYINQWLDRAKAEAGAGQQIATATQAQQQTINDRAKAAVGQAGQGINQEVAADARVRGNIATTGADALAQRFTQRQADLGARSGADETLRNQEAASGATRLAAQPGIIGMRGTEEQGNLANQFAKRLGDIGAKRSDVVASRGPLRTDILTKLRQSQFDNAITREGLNIKQKDLQASSADAAARIAETMRSNRAQEGLASARNDLTASGQDLTAQGQALTHADRLAAIQARLAKDKGTSGLTPAQRKYAAGVLARVDDAEAKIQDYIDAAKRNGNTATQAQVKALLREDKFHTYEIEGAFSKRHHKGKLTPAVVELLRQQHVPVPSSMRAGASKPKPTGNPIGAVVKALGG